MYNNQHGSPAFEEFLQLMGRKVKLKGFDDFRGGLDVKSKCDYTYLYCTTEKGLCIHYVYLWTFATLHDNIFLLIFTKLNY